MPTSLLRSSSAATDMMLPVETGRRWRPITKEKNTYVDMNNRAGNDDARGADLPRESGPSASRARHQHHPLPPAPGFVDGADSAGMSGDPTGIP